MPRVNVLIAGLRLFLRSFKVVPMLARLTLLSLASLSAISPRLDAQLEDRGASDAVRVTVSANQDGSHTTYEYDNANHKAVATTTSPAGKLVGKIRYDLDEANRFAAGEVYGADGKLRFKTIYKYDGAGRLIQETQTSKDGTAQNKIVYSYDQAGRQSGYAVYDAAGKLLGQTTPVAAKAPPKNKSK